MVHEVKSVDWSKSEEELIEIVRNHGKTMLVTAALLQGAPLFIRCGAMAEQILAAAEQIKALDTKHGES